MRAWLISVGSRMPSWMAQGFAEYTQRLSRELPLELIEIPLAIRSKSSDLARAKTSEGVAVLAAVPRHARTIVLDGRGKLWSSEQLAQELSQWRLEGDDLAFLVGGPDGHAAAVLERATQRWSLGPLTLPHMLVRLIVAEQLYRAVSLLNGHPYHRG